MRGEGVAPVMTTGASEGGGGWKGKGYNINKNAFLMHFWAFYPNKNNFKRFSHFKAMYLNKNCLGKTPESALFQGFKLKS